MSDLGRMCNITDDPIIIPPFAGIALNADAVLYLIALAIFAWVLIEVAREITR